MCSLTSLSLILIIPLALSILLGQATMVDDVIWGTSCVVFTGTIIETARFSTFNVPAIVGVPSPTLITTDFPLTDYTHDVLLQLVNLLLSEAVYTVYTLAQPMPPPIPPTSPHAARVTEPPKASTAPMPQRSADTIAAGTPTAPITEPGATPSSPSPVPAQTANSPPSGKMAWRSFGYLRAVLGGLTRRPGGAHGR